MARNRRTGGHPRVVVGAHVLEKAFERARTSRPADDAAVEPDGHHAPAFCTQLVERVDEIGEEVVGGDEAVRQQELEIVRVERVRDDEVIPARDVDPVRQLVGIRVRVVEEASFLDDEPPCALRYPTGVPADRPAAARLLDRGDRPPDVLALLVLGQVRVVDPPPSVTRYFPPCIDHGPRRGGVALQRLPDRIDRQRHVVGGEDAMHAPVAGTAAELEHRLGVEVAPADGRRRADHLVQERLRGRIALERRPLAPFLVVENEAERDAGSTGPAWVRRLPSIADEVARGHPTSPNTPAWASSPTRSGV